MNFIVVADLHRGKRKDGVYVNESTELIRKGVKVEKTYVDYVNGQSGFSEFYIIDEEATEARANGNEVKTDKPKKEVEPKTKEKVVVSAKDAELDALKDAYKELTGKDAKGTWGINKLTAEIARLQAQESNK